MSYALPRQFRQLREYPARAFAPGVAERREIRVVLLEAAAHVDDEAIALVADQVDGHADGKIASHCRIERNQDALGRIGQVGFWADDPVDDRLSILRFARL